MVSAWFLLSRFCVRVDYCKRSIWDFMIPKGFNRLISTINLNGFSINNLPSYLSYWTCLLCVWKVFLSMTNRLFQILITYWSSRVVGVYSRKPSFFSTRQGIIGFFWRKYLYFCFGGCLEFIVLWKPFPVFYGNRFQCYIENHF